jgi:hypothetical protein
MYGQKRSFDHLVSAEGRQKKRAGSTGPILYRAERLVRDRLVDELLHELAEIRSLRARRLRH